MNLTNEQHAAVTRGLVCKVKRSDPNYAVLDDDERIEAIVGLVVADVSLIADGVFTIEQVAGFCE